MRSVHPVKHLENRTQRAKLPVRRDPYWIRINESSWLGYRKRLSGGMWMVSARNRPNKSQLSAIELGAADDNPDDDPSGLTYEDAIDLARKWSQEQATRKGRRNQRKAYTVKDAMQDYLRDFVRRGYRSFSETKNMIEFSIVPQLGHIPVADLTRDQVYRWIQATLHNRGRVRHYRGGPVFFECEPMSEEDLRKRKQTANRLLGILKTGLTFALEEGFVDCSGAAWQYFHAFVGVRAGRTRFLSEEEQRMLVAACEGDYKNLALGGLYTGARSGELFRLLVDNFTGTAIYVPPQVAKTCKERTIFLDPMAITFFAGLVRGRQPQENLFTLEGKQWTQNDQWYRTKAVRDKMEMPDFAFCLLRHTAASNWIRAGIPIKYVAEQLGNNTNTCEIHYAHVAPNHRQELLSGFRGVPFADCLGIESEMGNDRSGS